MEDACMLTGSGVDTVYEALVIGDYIEELQARFCSKISEI